LAAALAADRLRQVVIEPGDRIVVAEHRASPAVAASLRRIASVHPPNGVLYVRRSLTPQSACTLTCPATTRLCFGATASEACHVRTRDDYGGCASLIHPT